MDLLGADPVGSILFILLAVAALAMATNRRTADKQTGGLVTRFKVDELGSRLPGRILLVSDGLEEDKIDCRAIAGRKRLELAVLVRYAASRGLLRVAADDSLAIDVSLLGASDRAAIKSLMTQIRDS